MDRRGVDLVEAQIMALQGMNIEALRDTWSEHLHRPPPLLRSADLLRRCLAEALQARAEGGGAEAERALAKLARAYGRGQAPREAKSTFKPGTVLTREHGGHVHRVEVLADGFRWNGEVHQSLSAIARAITGIRWNGPRFFGLREERKPSRDSGAKRAAGGRS